MPSGAPAHEIWGETFWPSHVCFAGIISPSWKEGLVTRSVPDISLASASRLVYTGPVQRRALPTSPSIVSRAPLSQVSG